jgi:hypothetical protein
MFREACYRFLPSYSDACAVGYNMLSCRCRLTAGVKEPGLELLARADPNKTYALCVTTPITTAKEGTKALVLVPPEAQLWQKVGFAAIAFMLTTLTTLGIELYARRMRKLIWQQTEYRRAFDCGGRGYQKEVDVVLMVYLVIKCHCYDDCPCTGGSGQGDQDARTQDAGSDTGMRSLTLRKHHKVEKEAGPEGRERLA